ncbi:MAG: sigma-54 dependent transcriptional regulator [Oryzomonas sp.]|uniref:sigma-54-dependent transcriptional regulator n=1 Tax=Oryzomonas sp. TaxID=2855186 RepID=UPI00284C88FF|nr:sigma-54 dependent transcriptional regulator [Oryzomonas sp.]MDR3581178.1 sigma-54 dependent transcriptional regulator [Oryzomonas sp.]
MAMNNTPFPPRILVVDDEEVSRFNLRGHLQRLEYDVVCAVDANEALYLLGGQRVDLVITDQVMPEIDGLQLMQCVHESQPSLPFIVLTAQGSVESAVAAMKSGAIDYLEKPINSVTFKAIIQRALEFGRLSDENRQLRERLHDQFSFQNIITQSPAMRTVLEVAKRITTSPKTIVNLTGESGVGKEVLARAIHYASGCLPDRFVAINCAAIPESLLESELFGHERGAFTGAEREREGKFSLARGGTVLLDEIGDMPILLQAKLLRVLEEHAFEKVGSNTAIPADFRVIAATHRNLAKLVQEGSFREDLFHRINVVSIEIPPLRDRKEDIPILVDFFLEQFRRHLGKSLPGISKIAMNQLMSYSWPGNIRELRNVLEYAAIMVCDELIRPEHLRFTAAGGQTGDAGNDAIEFGVSIPAHEFSLNAIIKHALEFSLQRCCGNKSNAAALLKINRKMFYR